jgi:hypothetical protein
MDRQTHTHTHTHTRTHCQENRSAGLLTSRLGDSDPDGDLASGANDRGSATDGGLPSIRTSDLYATSDILDDGFYQSLDGSQSYNGDDNHRSPSHGSPARVEKSKNNNSNNYSSNNYNSNSNTNNTTYPVRVWAPHVPPQPCQNSDPIAPHPNTEFILTEVASPRRTGGLASPGARYLQDDFDKFDFDTSREA